MSRLATEFPDPRQSPGLLLWQVTNAWQRQIRSALTPHSLTHVQFVLLATLASTPTQELTQRRLAELAATDVMMTSQVVRALETKGLVERAPHPRDKRAVLITPTAAGIAVVNNAIGAVEAADALFFAALEGGELDNFVASLDTLVAARIATDR